MSLINLLALMGETPTPIDSIYYTGLSDVILGDTYENAINPFGGTGLYDPTSYYSNGRTYFVYKRNQNSSDGKPVISEYYNGSISTRVVTEVTMDNLDYHNHPTVIVDENGYIWLIQEFHGSVNNGFYKSDNPYDISAFTKVADGCAFNYPKTTYNNGFLNVFGRVGNVTTGVQRYNIGTNTWAAYNGLTSITNSFPGSTEARHYPFIGSNFYYDGWYYISVARRDTVGGSFYYRNVYLLKTQDYDTFTNIQEASSRDVSTQPAYGENELDTGYRIWNDDTNTSAGQFGNGPLGSENRATFSGTKQLSSYDAGWSRAGTELVRLLQYGNSHWDIQDSNGLGIYESLDKATVNKKQNLPSDGLGIWVPTFPKNFHDIPIGQKFVMAAGTKKNSDTDVINSTTQNNVIWWEFVKN